VNEVVFFSEYILAYASGTETKNKEV